MAVHLFLLFLMHVGGLLLYQVTIGDTLGLRDLEGDGWKIIDEQ